MSKPCIELLEELEYAWLSQPREEGESAGGEALTPGDTSLVQHIRLGIDPALRLRFMVTDEPVRANLRVGLLLEVLDRLAEVTALRYVRLTHPEARVVTASIDDLKVCAPPDLERDIVLSARVNFVGNTSLEVGIRIEHLGHPAVHLGSCYFTMVAKLPEDKGGAKLPPLNYVSDLERARAERAALRRNHRRVRAPQAPPNPEEWQHLLELHALRAQVPSKAHLARDLVVSTWERTYPEHENVPQTVFGGYILHRAYMCANMCAELVADRRALLAAANRIDFYEPVRMGDKLHFLSRVRYTGSTSVSVETEIIRVSRDGKSTELSNTCVFTFVNVDENLNCVPVLPVIPDSFNEDARYLEGLRRHKGHITTKVSDVPPSPSGC
jgi:acyl-coenzyme A thioesterase 9